MKPGAPGGVGGGTSQQDEDRARFGPALLWRHSPAGWMRCFAAGLTAVEFVYGREETKCVPIIPARVTWRRHRAGVDMTRTG